MDSGAYSLSLKCRCCGKQFMSLARGRKAAVCDACFRTTNGRIAEIRNYCENNPKAELFQISKALNVSLSEVLGLINYNNEMGGDSIVNQGVAEKGSSITRKIYSEEREQERRRINRDSSSKLVADLGRFHRNK